MLFKIAKNLFKFIYSFWNETSFNFNPVFIRFYSKDLQEKFQSS